MRIQKVYLGGDKSDDIGAKIRILRSAEGSVDVHRSYCMEYLASAEK